MSMNNKSIFEILNEFSEKELGECVKEVVTLYDTGRIPPFSKVAQLAARFDFLPKGSGEKLVERHALQYAAKQWLKMGEQ